MSAPAPPSVLYLTYHGLAHPLGRAQCVPYLLGLAGERRARLAVISFEDDPLPGPELVARVGAAGIAWSALRYHGWPKGLAKLLDIATGLWAALRFRRRFDVVHARSYVMAAMALAIKKVTGIPYMFEMLGMLADEYADVGYWSRSGFFYRVTKRAERILLREAGAVLVHTRRNARYMRDTGLVPERIPLVVLPCCVDLKRFRCAGEGYPRDRAPRLVYSGGLGTWYMLDEMLDLFAAARRVTPDLVFRIVTRADHGMVREALGRKGMTGDGVEVMSAHPDEMTGLLCSSDVGLTFIRPLFSKEASSPNKFAEYLASGLPVITNAGVGDLDDTMREERVGAVVATFDPVAYETAWRAVVGELRSAPAALRERCRAVAARDFDARRGVDAYGELYQALAARPR